MPEQDEILNMGEWYTLPQAIERLNANSGYEVDPSTPRILARSGKVRTHKLTERATLYLRADIDPYVVEKRGTKVARAQRQRSVEMKRQKAKGGQVKTRKVGRPQTRATRPRKTQPVAQDEKQSEGGRALDLAG